MEARICLIKQNETPPCPPIIWLPWGPSFKAGAVATLPWLLISEDLGSHWQCLTLQYSACFILIPFASTERYLITINIINQAYDKSAFCLSSNVFHNRCARLITRRPAEPPLWELSPDFSPNQCVRNRFCIRDGLGCELSDPIRTNILWCLSSSTRITSHCNLFWITFGHESDAASERAPTRAMGWSCHCSIRIWIQIRCSSYAAFLCVVPWCCLLYGGHLWTLWFDLHPSFQSRHHRVAPGLHPQLVHQPGRRMGKLQWPRRNTVTKVTESNICHKHPKPCQASWHLQIAAQECQRMSNHTSSETSS